MKKVLIIGESNSVMIGGWVEGFSNAIKDTCVVDNFSCGSTGMLNAIYHISLVNLESYDLVVLDHFINDVRFYIASKEEYFFLIGLLYDFLIKSKVDVVSLVFKRHDLAGDFDVFHNEIVEFLNAYNAVLVFDTYRFIKNISASKNISTFYKDSAHPYPEFSYKIGQELASQVKIRSNYNSIKNEFPFHVLHANDVSNCADVNGMILGRIKNRLVDVGFFSVKEQCKIQVPDFIFGGRLIGFYFNASTADGFLKVNEEILKLVSNGNYGKKPVIWARPIHANLIIKEELSLVVVPTANKYEKTEFCSVGKHQQNASLDLISLIFLLPIKRC